MPPQGKLPAETIAAVREWVAAGAPIPAVTPSAGDSLAGTGVRPVALRGVITDADKNFWAFKPISQAAPPAPKQKDWAVNPIDAFILANLEKNGLKPAPPADKTTLLRRATFDLTGLPPTEKELQDFLADKSPNAFEKVVDRLLASPRYGERWGRHWLDVMRYADSTGSDEDHRYPHAWRYRDYVVAGLQRRHAVQPVRARATGRRHSGRRSELRRRLSRHRRHRFPCARKESPGAKGPAAEALRRGGRSDRCHVEGVSRSHRRLRALPRS